MSPTLVLFHLEIQNHQIHLRNNIYQNNRYSKKPFGQNIKNLGLINLILWSTFCTFLCSRVSVPVSIGTYFPTKEMLSTHIKYFCMFLVYKFLNIFYTLSPFQEQFDVDFVHYHIFLLLKVLYFYLTKHHWVICF